MLPPHVLQHLAQDYSEYGEYCTAKLGPFRVAREHRSTRTINLRATLLPSS